MGKITKRDLNPDFQAEIDKLAVLEYINAIEQNYPPEHYVMLSEALDYCLEMLKEKLN